MTRSTGFAWEHFASFPWIADFPIRFSDLAEQRVRLYDRLIFFLLFQLTVGIVILSWLM
jgi:hypothetical protein